MNFFKSVFTEESTPPDSPKSEPESDSPTSQQPDPTHESSAWSFGGMIKTLTTKSDTILETYRKDFHELTSGLKNETSIIRQVASRAVKDLPASFEAGASIAQESLENVGQAIDDIGSTVWKSTAQIISHGNPSIFTPFNDNNDDDVRKDESLNAKRYSRFDMQVNAIRCDINTYCNDPRDEVDYDYWRTGVFNLEEMKLEIERLIRDNKAVKQIYDDLVGGNQVDYDTFWSRYFYRVYKLKQADEARALLVKRAISGEEDLSWDFEEEDVDDSKSNINDTSGGSFKCREKAEVKKGSSESCKHSDVSVVSSHQPILREKKEELGWDDMEEVEDSKEGVAMGSVASTSTVDLRQQLSAAGEDEDLSWDIDDEDDESHKP